jgi:hypothetical protein
VRGRLSLLLGQNRITMTVPTVPGWNRPGGRGGWTLYGSNLLSRDVQGLADPEAALYWTDLSGPGWAELCPGLIEYPTDPYPTVPPPTAAEAAAEIAAARGTTLVSGPEVTTVGGRPALRIVVTVHEDLGCDPGYFYTWRPALGGPSWSHTEVGDTITVWVVDLRSLLFLASETTHDAPTDLTREIEGIVATIRWG